MTLPWEGNRIKTKVADELILRLMDSVYRVNSDVEFSLRVFGHQSTVQENDCHDTRNEVPFAKDNKLQMEYRLDDIKPLGVTSIAYALQQAAEYDLIDVNRNAYSIILITDGGESCGGDICAVMKKLAESKVFFRPYIINLESSASVRASYTCMGDYLEVTRGSDIPTAVSTIVRAFRPVINVNTKEYTSIKEVAAKSPTVMGVTIPTVKVSDTVKTVVTMPVPAPPPPPAPKRPTPEVINSLPVSGMAMVRIYAPTPVLTAARKVAPYKAVVTEEAPPPPPAPEPRPVVNVDKVAPAGIVTIKMPLVTPAGARLTRVSPYVAVVPDEPWQRPALQAIDRLAGGKAGAMTMDRPRQPIAKERAVAPYKPLIVEELPQLPPPEKIARVVPMPAKRIMTFILLENGTESRLRSKIPPLPPLKFDAEPPVAVKPVTPTKPAVPVKPGPKLPEPKIAEYTIEKEDAEKTTVEVYFTNGHGKFFPTTPQVLILEPGTDKMVKRFYRTVDADGNPDPQEGIPPGTYKLAFSETRSLVVNNVVIEPNKRNKVIVTVKKASLSFEYGGNLGRPVKEFEAVVIERNKVEGGSL
ncbi:hypothetical protein GCM10023093_09760 [Nemorincola caseinilytica]|uniref:VWFA domain-containing protein n=2 Tax=Nemorincola caseinilytica TaxID=2054315 RepID=A0ABP8N7J8_9BACT